jgi:hypothetical protein
MKRTKTMEDAQRTAIFSNLSRNFLPPMSVTQDRSSESEEGMVLQAKLPRIETLHSYPASLVDELHRILDAGAPARPDSHRKDFYEIEGDEDVFYVHMSPVNGRVLLLAVWKRSDLPELMSANIQAA